MADTPYMKMKLPVPGSTPAGEWGSKLNRALEEHVDSHDHASGRGKPINPNGIAIDRDLPMSGHQLTEAAAVELVDQSPAPTGTRRLYAADGDLWWIDKTGTKIRLTEGGQIVPGIVGVIDGLEPPAKVVYDSVSNVYRFFQNAAQEVRALLDVAEVSVRRAVSGAKRVILRTAEGMANDYTLTLPAATPGSKLPVSLDEAGQLSTGQLETAQIADGAVTTAKITGIGAPDGIAPLDEHGTVVGTAAAASNAPGVRGVGDGSAPGVAGRGGVWGVYGVSGGAGPGVLGAGSEDYDEQGVGDKTAPGIVGQGTAATSGDGANGVEGYGGGEQGKGVYGIGQAAGVHGVGASGGYGVVAESATGVAFRIVPRSTAPTESLAAAGDMYVNTSGRLFIFTGGAWRQVTIDGI